MPVDGLVTNKQAIDQPSLEPSNQSLPNEQVAPNKQATQLVVNDKNLQPVLNGAPTTFDNPLCMQKNYTTDFSVQANAVEAAFQAIKEQTYLKTYGVMFSTSYWLTDTLTPGVEGFPNISQSIRGKPAETIVKNWYAK
jgi:hypothetical protein